MDEEFRVLQAAREVVREIEELLDDPRRRLLHDVQLRRSAQSITANIREAQGRREGPERNQLYRYAQGSSEETDEHLLRNFEKKRIPASRYWRLHNRLSVIAKMLRSLMARKP